MKDQLGTAKSFNSSPFGKPQPRLTAYGIVADRPQTVEMF